MHGVGRKAVLGAAAAALALVPAACGDDDVVAPGVAEARLGVVVTTPDAAPAQPGLTFTAAGGQVVTLTQVQLVASELELDPADESDDLEEFESGPVTVDLALAGNVVTAVESPVPAGIYDELELEIEQIRLVGTVDGQAFAVLVPVDTELEVEFLTPLVVVEDERVSFVLGIDLAALFVTRTGTFLDPTAVLTDPALRADLIANLELAFEDFDDFDEDDFEDD